MLRTTALAEPEMTAPTQMLPFASLTPAAMTEKRYDAKTVEKAVALASRMQAEHEETLSSEEIESIAAEAGIRPEFMRRALMVLETPEAAQQTQVSPVALRSSERKAALRKRRLTRRQRSLIFGVPPLYILSTMPVLALAITGMNSFPNTLAVATFFTFLIVLPGLLSLTLGASLPRKRQGAFAGALTGFGVFVAAVICSAAFGHASGPASAFFAGLSIFAAAGAFLGFTGTWLKQNLPLLLAALSSDNETEAEMER